MNIGTNRAVLVACLLAASAGGALLSAGPASGQMGYGAPPPPPPSTQNFPTGQPAEHHSTSGGKPHLSKSIQGDIVDAQKMLQAKDFQGALAKLKDARAATDLQPYDNYIIESFTANAAIGLNDMPTAAVAEEAAADSGAVPDDDRKSVLHNAMQLSAYIKQWPKAIAYGQQLAQLNGLDFQGTAVLAMAYYNENDFPHAQQYAQQSIDLAKAAGQAPDQNALQIVMGSQVKQNNQAGAVQTLEQLALANGTPDTWAQLVGVTFGAKGMSDPVALYLYRLLVVAGAMKSSDYKEMGSLLAELGYPTEAENVLQQGLSAGKASNADVGAMLAKARRDAAADARALPEIVASAAKSRTGEQEVKLGEDYWGYGRYADAEAAAREAMAKGGLKTPSEGPLLVGAAQVAQGKYGEAMQTLAQVSGSEAVTRTAHMWSLYAQAKQGRAQASAQPASQPPSR